MADDVNHFLKEWEATRDVLKTFDGHLHDLRKYGFTFITALLTGSAILFTVWIREPVFYEGNLLFEGELFPEHVKAAILAVTLFLIMGLFMIDIYYRLFQKAANIRSRILEKVLNIELSDTITQRYHSAGFNKYLVSSVYCIFVLGVLSLGISVLSNSLLWLSLVVLGSLLVVVVLSLGDRFFYLIHYDYGLMDWILDRLECGVGDEVRVIMTNIGNKPMSISANETMWNLFKEGGNAPLRSGVTPANIVIGSFQNYMWVLKTGADEKRGEKELKPGIYRIEVRPLQKNSDKLGPLGPRGEMRPLSRKLRIKSSGGPQVHHVKLVENAKQQERAASVH